MRHKRGFAILEVVLLLALVGVIVVAVYLSTNKPNAVTSNSVANKTTTQSKQTDGTINTSQDLDAVIEANEAESMADIDTELVQIDQDFKDL